MNMQSDRVPYRLHMTSAGAGPHRGAVAGHRAGRARDGHQDAGGDGRRRPGPHVRLRHRRDARADAAHPRPGHQARLPPHPGARIICSFRIEQKETFLTLHNVSNRAHPHCSQLLHRCSAACVFLTAFRHVLRFAHELALLDSLFGSKRAVCWLRCSAEHHLLRESMCPFRARSGYRKVHRRCGECGAAADPRASRCCRCGRTGRSSGFGRTARRR